MTNVRDLLIVTTTCLAVSPSLIQALLADWALTKSKVGDVRAAATAP